MNLVWFFVITFAFTWSLLPFAQQSIGISLLALCGPAVGARVVSGLGSPETRREFSGRLNEWRVAPKWYLLALLLPMPVSAFARNLEYVLGAKGPIELMPVTPDVAGSSPVDPAISYWVRSGDMGNIIPET